MRKDKMNAAELVELLAQQTNVSKKMADEFLKTLLTTIEDALFSHESVKINGLGSFKLQWNEPRKSVDVNTGAEIVIDGYYRIVFIPDAELKELANEPYAHLQPVLLDNEENTPENVSPEPEDSVGIPLKMFNEQATEIKEILSEINALSGKQEKTNKEAHTVDLPIVVESKQETVPLEPPMATYPVPESEPVEETIESPVMIDSETETESVEDATDPVVEMIENAEEESIADSIEEVKPEAKRDEEKVISTGKHRNSLEEIHRKQQLTENFHPERIRKSPKTYRTHKFDILFISIMVGGLLFYILIDFNLLSVFKNLFIPKTSYEETVQLKEEPVIEPEIIFTDSIVSDSIPQDTTSSVTDNNIAEVKDVKREEQDELQLLFDRPRVYTEFITTEKVIAGSRLTRIAERHYGVKEFWVYIFEANRNLLGSPDDIAIGMVLKIPKLNPKLADANNPRCIEYALKLHDEYVKIK
jgi:nucleoid DNA-binding protein/nucleoid-associated protein YgaU